MAAKTHNKAVAISSPAPSLQGAKVGSHSGAEQLTKALTFAVKNGKKEGFRVELGEDKNLYKWQIHLFDFPATSNLAYVLQDRKNCFSVSCTVLVTSNWLQHVVGWVSS